MGVSISGRMTRAYCSSPRKCFSWRDRLLMEAERHVDRDDVLGKVSNQIGHTCQSFAFVRAAELAFRIHYGLKLKLSMQDLLDAGQVFGTEKSVSGNAFRNEIIVFKWIQKNGIYLEGDYPELIIRWLDELDGYCDQLTRWLFEDDNYPNQFQDCKIKVGGRMIKPGSDGINLLHAIHRQPVLLGIYFEDDQFFYLKGELYKERKKSSQVMSGLIDYIDQSTEMDKGQGREGILGIRV